MLREEWRKGLTVLWRWQSNVELFPTRRKLLNIDQISTPNHTTNSSNKSIGHTSTSDKALIFTTFAIHTINRLTQVRQFHHSHLQEPIYWWIQHFSLWISKPTITLWIFKPTSSVIVAVELSSPLTPTLLDMRRYRMY